jgi:PleD family two-component response regulator
MGERVNMIGALSVEAAARHLKARDIDGIVVGDGFSPRMVQAFLTVLSQEARFRDIPVAVIGRASDEIAESLINVDHVDGDPNRLVARMLPLVRMHAFEGRLKRMLASLDADGVFDPETGLLTHEAFWRELDKAINEASDCSQALSVARLSFDGPLEARVARDGARLLSRLIRNIDFATREDDGALLIVFTQTNLRSAHVVARRIASALKNALFPARRPEKIAANITLATLKAGDTLDSLMLRVRGSRMVAAE